MYCDVRSFKQLNDEFGHLAGDHVLKVIAQRLAATIGGRDLAARWGGDEFLIIVQDESKANLVRLRHELIDTTSEPIQLPNSSVVVYPHLTIGYARRMQGPSVEIEDLLHRADTDMYRQRRMALRGSDVVDAPTRFASV